MTWALVSGGSKNLGRELSLFLAQSGYKVLIHYRESKKEAEETLALCKKNSPESCCIQGDFSTKESTESFIQRCAQEKISPKILINNVGNYHIGSLESTRIEQWESLMDLNGRLPLQLMLAFAEDLKRQKGTVINMGVCGLNRNSVDVYSPAYTICKQSLLGIVRTLAKEWMQYGVRVNMISPSHLPSSVDLPQDKSILPEQRPVEYEEVLRALAFLIDPQNSLITGQNLEIAGGLRL